MVSAAPDNANPVIHSSAGPSRRSKNRADAFDLSDDDEWDRTSPGVDGMDVDDALEEEIDAEEIFGQFFHPDMLVTSKADSKRYTSPHHLLP
jgi:hypothetical protein